MLTSRASNPIDKSRVADRIFLDLKQQIITGRLPHGTKLPTERELAEHYAVSAPTIREAIRGLTVIGLVEVRHGSGAYVCANGESLVAMSLSTVIQLENVGASDALGILSVLNSHAAVCAVKQATPADLRRLRETAEALADVQSAERAAVGVRAFHRALALASHNALLAVICSFLADVQVEFAKQITGNSLESWKGIIDSLQNLRMRFVEAIERRDEKAAARYAREFHAEAVRRIMSLPRAQEVRLADPQLAALLSSAVGRMTRRP